MNGGSSRTSSLFICWTRRVSIACVVYTHAHLLPLFLFLLALLLLLHCVFVCALYLFIKKDIVLNIGHYQNKIVGLFMETQRLYGTGSRWQTISADQGHPNQDRSGA
jgi:choline-glycine betaine transporter